MSQSHARIRKLPVHDHMTHVVKIDILTGHKEKGNYPLAQQSCGEDIGSVPYVCEYVRTFVCMFTHSSDLIYYPISI